MKNDHDLRVKKVASQVRNFYESKKPARIYRGGTHSTRSIKFKKDEVIDITELSNVIEVNVEERYVLVEPNVSMKQLVSETLKYGMIPPVVMEFPGITVGGAVQGGAGESSSFKYGLFHNICTEYELVLGNGEIVTVSEDNLPNLYLGIPGSYGSLGVVTLVQLKLIPAKQFVELTYSYVEDTTATLRLIETERQRNSDFLDAILFSKDHGVRMSGMLTDKKNYPITTFGKSSDEWFYLHAKRVNKANPIRVETIPLEEYLFRYDRGAFWMGSLSFSVFKIPFNRFTRLIFNVFLNTTTLYRSLHSAGFAQEYIIQDFCLPAENADHFLSFCEENAGIYPIWLCPLTVEKNAKLSSNYLNAAQAINIGIYGSPVKVQDLFVLNRKLEMAVSESGGRKWLYAETYYGREEFWNIYDSYWYSSLRKKCHAEITFPDMYEKVHVKERRSGSVTKGFFQFMRSPFRLRR